MGRPGVTLLLAAMLIAASHNGAVRPASAQPLRCGGADARNAGLVGDGTANDGPALLAVDASDAPFIYAAPEGDILGSRQITIRTNTRLNKPLVLGASMRILVARRVRFNMRAQIFADRTQVFFGAGQVRFGLGLEVTVLPEWWGQGNAAYDKMATACSLARCMVAWTGLYGGFTRPLNVRPSLQMWSGPIIGLEAGAFEPNAPAVGFNFQPGDYTANQPYVLPSLGKFGTAVQATSTNGLRVFVQGVSDADTAVAVQGDVGTTTIESGLISRMRVVFGIAASSLRSTTLFNHFAVNTANGPASLAEFRSSPVIENSRVEFSSVDGNTPNPNVALARNTVPNAISNFVLSVKAWGGNFQPGINLVAGAFSGLRMLIRMASMYASASTGPDIAVKYGSFNVAQPKPMSADPNNPGERIDNNFKVLFIPDTQLPGVWGIDEDRNFYVSHSLLSGGQQRRIIMTPGPTGPGASNWYNPGIVVKELVDESNIAPYRLRITLTNKSNQPITADSLLTPWFRGEGLDWRLYISVPGVGSA